MKDDRTLREEYPGLYHIARERGTEPPFLGTYVHTTDPGVYVCAVCASPLFLSHTKFDAGHGWPSFTHPITINSVSFYSDCHPNQPERTEVRCKKCDAHLGHLYHDGPDCGDGKCEERYSINSISLELIRGE